MQTNSFTVQIYFVAIFVIDFCSVCQYLLLTEQGHHCQNIALHHYLLPSWFFFMTPATAVNKFCQ
ncbi:Uncharacterised protein [Escherichia coli]|nr:Uncharacterised protein [Escherichia coli]